jgi:hypothetical protein
MDCSLPLITRSLWQKRVDTEDRVIRRGAGQRTALTIELTSTYI